MDVCVASVRRLRPPFSHPHFPIPGFIQGVIVTGGGTGLGFAIAKELVGIGAQVVIAGA